MKDVRHIFKFIYTGQPLKARGPNVFTVQISGNDECYKRQGKNIPFTALPCPKVKVNKITHPY